MGNFAAATFWRIFGNDRPEHLERLAPVITNSLFVLSRLEFEGQKGLHRHWAPVHGVRLEFPLLHAIDRNASKGQRPLQELRILDRAVPPD